MLSSKVKVQHSGTQKEVSERFLDLCFLSNRTSCHHFGLGGGGGHSCEGETGSPAGFNNPLNPFILFQNEAGI